MAYENSFNNNFDKTLESVEDRPAGDFFTVGPGAYGLTIDEIDKQKIFIGNLPKYCTSTDLFKLFRQYGEILEAVAIPNDGKTECRGYGFVTFKDIHDTDFLLNTTDPIFFESIELAVNPAKPTTKNKFYLRKLNRFKNTQVRYSDSNSTPQIIQPSKFQSQNIQNFQEFQNSQNYNKSNNGNNSGTNNYQESMGNIERFNSGGSLPSQNTYLRYNSNSWSSEMNMTTNTAEYSQMSPNSNPTLASSQNTNSQHVETFIKALQLRNIFSQNSNKNENESSDSECEKVKLDYEDNLNLVNVNVNNSKLKLQSTKPLESIELCSQEKSCEVSSNSDMSPSANCPQLQVVSSSDEPSPNFIKKQKKFEYLVNNKNIPETDFLEIIKCKQKSRDVIDQQKEYFIKQYHSKNVMDVDLSLTKPLPINHLLNKIFPNRKFFQENDNCQAQN